MRKEWKWRLFFLLALLSFLFWGSLGGICEEEEVFQADYRVEQTFSLRYGLGDALGLAKVGLSPYQLSLDQSLAVDITGEALSFLTLDAHFNNKEPESMQSLTVGLNAGALRGVFFDFSMSGQETFAVYNKKLKGARLDYSFGEAELTGIFSLIEGISESRTFIGRTAHDERLFSRTVPDRPWISQSYPYHIEGLYTYELEVPYVEGFSEVVLGFDVVPELKRLLTDYDLGYLFDLLLDTPAEELAAGSFVIIDDAEELLLLRRDSISLLRERLQDAIYSYNLQEGLSGSELKIYPFNTGTDYEIAFLEQLIGWAHLDVDEEIYPLVDGTRRRFYNLGQSGIKESSLLVEISLNGGTFRALDDPEFSEYHVELHAEEGILEIDFPSAFFEGAENAVRVTFDYAISGDFFALGYSLVLGSDRVYLNDRLLERDVDYSIDYEGGLLTLFVEVSDEDVIRVDYERYRGGLGGTAEYARTFGGVMLDVPISEAIHLNCSLLEAADLLGSVSDPEKTRTMPNRHIVSGIVGEVSLEDFTADFTLGYADNRFPFDDNLRVNLPNEITDILVVDGDIFASHLDGVSVRHAGIWHAYDSADGLSGNRVYDMVTDGEHVFFGTGSGLTVLSLVGDAPLDRVGNWDRYYAASETAGTMGGLPNAVVRALAWVNGTLWIGTDEGLAAVRIEEIDDLSRWRVYTDGPFAEIGSIRALAGKGEVMYIGTDRGLYRFDTVRELLEVFPGTEGRYVYDLLIDGESLYVASASGLRSYHDGMGSGWLVLGEPVISLALVDNELWYGNEDGLFRGPDREVVLTDWTVTAVLATSEGTVWAGSRADADYELRIWEIEGQHTRSYNNLDSQIDGHDPSRFSNIPAEAHTDRGLLGQFNFYRDMGAFSLRGHFESVAPTFTSIGRLDRRDATGWSLAASAHPLEALQLDASHEFSLIDWRQGRPSSVVENQIVVAWIPGPQIDLSFTQGAVNNDRFHAGFEQSGLGYSLGMSDTLFDERLNLSLSWKDDYSYNALLDRLTRRNQLRMQGGLQVTPELSTSLSWGRPMTVVEGERTGSETWRFTTDWAHQFEAAKAEADYTLSVNRPLLEGTFTATQAASFEVGFRQFKFKLWRVTPRFDLSFDQQAEKRVWTGRGVLIVDLQTVSATLSYRSEFTDWDDPRSQRRDQFSVSLEYTGIPHLRPTLSYTVNTNTLTYQEARRTTVDHALTGRLRWQSNEGPQDDLSFTIRRSSREETAATLTTTLRNTFSYPMTETITARMDLDARYGIKNEEPDFNLDLVGSVDVALTEVLHTSLGVSYYTGLKSSGDLYHSLLIEWFIAAVFQ
jgi:hypothetical protein